MKKVICAIFALGLAVAAYGQSPEATKIVNSLQGAGAPCKTADGRNGRMYTQSVTTTTTTTQSSGQTQNSGSTSTSTSVNAEATIKNFGGSMSNTDTYHSGSTSNSSGTQATTTTSTTSVCVPYNK